MNLSTKNKGVETRFLTPMIWCVILICTFAIGLGTTTIFGQALAYAPAVMVCLSLVMLWSIRKKAKRLVQITHVYFVLLAFGIAFNWFVNAGAYGTELFVYVVLVQIYFLVFQRLTSSWFSYFLCILVIACYTIDHFFPDFSEPFVSEDLAYWDRIITFGFLMAFTVYFSFISRREVRRERKDVENKQKELLNVNKQIAQTLEQREDFISMMSHEMKTPLTAIIGFGGILTASEQSNDIQEMGKHILTSGKRLDLFVDQVLAYSDIQRSNHKWHKEETDIRLFFDRTLKQYKITSAIPEAILISIDDLLPAKVQIDAKKTAMIFNVFVGNAEKFGNGQAVDCIIGYDPARKTIKLEVRDLGPGIPEEAFSSVLEPFQQLDSGPNRQHDGAGLGLSIAKAYVESAGGTLLLKNLEPQGLSVTAIIPVD